MAAYSPSNSHQNFSAPPLYSSADHSMPPPNQIRCLITIKLDGNNYSAWRSQLDPLLTCYDLYRFVDGSHPCPPRFIDNNYSNVNPYFQHWKTRDEITLDSLFSSLSDHVLANVASLQSSRAVWVALEERYGYGYCSSPLQLNQILETPILKSIRKRKLSMFDYLFEAKRLANIFADLGHPILDSDLQQIILKGLDGPLYRDIVTTLTAKVMNRKSVLSMEEFCNHLLAYETHLIGSVYRRSVWALTAVPNLVLIMLLAIILLKESRSIIAASIAIVLAVASFAFGLHFFCIYESKYKGMKTWSSQGSCSSSSATEKKEIKSYDIEAPSISSPSDASGLQDNNV